MRSTAPEVGLLVAAAALLGWGIVRAVARGEPAVGSWTTCALVALLLASPVNMVIRARFIAILVVVVSSLLGLVTFAAAGLAVADGNAFAVSPTVRALLFLLCLVVVGALQARGSGEAAA